jgi:hypothetical protein
MEIKSISEPNASPAKGAKARWRGPLSVVAFLAVAIATVAMGFYAGRVLNPAELVHFTVPLPVGRVDRPRMIGQDGGRRSFIKPIKVDVCEQGILKRIFCPWIDGLSTHWILNIDSKPHRVGMRLENTTFPVEWQVHAGIPWDPETKTFARALEPGEKVPELGIDWMFNFPAEVRSKRVWYEGGLSVFDADSGEVLTFIPITFLNSGATHEDSGV